MINSVFTNHFRFYESNILHIFIFVNNNFHFFESRFTFLKIGVMIYLYKIRKVENMSLSYEPLWQMLNELNISKMEFARMIDISNATLAKIGKNEPITLTTVDKICNRFNCKIENVVKHVPDLTIQKANFMIRKGMIVLANEIPQIDINRVKEIGGKFHVSKRPHVILDIVSIEGDNDPQNIENTPYDDLTYAVAPLYTSLILNNSPLNVPFENIEIDGVLTSGVVAFGKLSVMDSGLFEKHIGQMPDNYIQKFDKILQTIVGVVNEKDD